MRNLVKRLEKRGWKKHEIDKAVRIINNAKENKLSENSFLEKRIYWILLFVIIAANFAISIALVPVLMVLNGFKLYLVIVVLGVVFGLLFELVIRSIEHLETKHHVALAIMIPAIALINILVVARISNRLIQQLGLNNLHSALFVGLVYAFSFVIPYRMYRFVWKIEYYGKE